MKSTHPMTTGVSRVLMLSIRYLPMPGMAKTVSHRTVVTPSRLPNWIPMTVMTGMRAFLSAWLMMTFRSTCPLPRAVRM